MRRMIAALMLALAAAPSLAATPYAPATSRPRLAG